MAGSPARSPALPIPTRPAAYQTLADPVTRRPGGVGADVSPGDEGGRHAHLDA